MNKTKRIVIKIVLFILIIATGIYSFFAYGAYFTFDTSQMEIVVAAVTSSPPLPDNFVKFYIATHPDSYRSFKGTLASHAFDNNSQNCPCQKAAAHLGIQMASGDAHKIVQLTFFIKAYATQRQCLEFVMDNTWFANNNKGVSKASRYYYGKELENLSDDEMLELIAMSKNPYFYNKKQFPIQLAQQVERLKEKMKTQ